jgi:hypothetical protein
MPPRRLSGMAQLEAQITLEIKKIAQDMDAQKRLIKNSLGNAPILDAAEQELKALHTRLALLKGNLNKLRKQAPANETASS